MSLHWSVDWFKVFSAFSITYIAKFKFLVSSPVFKAMFQFDSPNPPLTCDQKSSKTLLQSSNQSSRIRSGKLNSESEVSEAQNSCCYDQNQSVENHKKNHVLVHILILLSLSTGCHVRVSLLVILFVSPISGKLWESVFVTFSSLLHSELHVSRVLYCFSLFHILYCV